MLYVVDERKQYMIKEKYSISECLWTDIIKALNNEYDNSQNILLRNNTPKELVKLGVKDLKMMTSVGHLKQNILTIEEAEKKKLSTNNKHWHGLGINTYVNAIKSIDKPVRIYQWLPNNENKYNLCNKYTENSGHSCGMIILKYRESYFTFNTGTYQTAYCKLYYS